MDRVTLRSAGIFQGYPGPPSGYHKQGLSSAQSGDEADIWAVMISESSVHEGKEFSGAVRLALEADVVRGWERGPSRAQKTLTIHGRWKEDTARGPGTGCAKGWEPGLSGRTIKTEAASLRKKSDQEHQTLQEQVR